MSVPSSQSASSSTSSTTVQHSSKNEQDSASSENQQQSVSVNLITRTLENLSRGHKPPDLNALNLDSINTDDSQILREISFRRRLKEDFTREKQKFEDSKNDNRKEIDRLSQEILQSQIELQTWEKKLTEQNAEITRLKQQNANLTAEMHQLQSSKTQT